MAASVAIWKAFSAVPISPALVSVTLPLESAVPVRVLVFRLLMVMSPAAGFSGSLPSLVLISTCAVLVFRFSVRFPLEVRLTSPSPLTVIAPPTVTSIRLSALASSPLAMLIVALPAAEIPPFSPAPMSPVCSDRKIFPVSAVAFSWVPSFSSNVRVQSVRRATVRLPSSSMAIALFCASPVSGAMLWIVSTAWVLAASSITSAFSSLPMEFLALSVISVPWTFSVK